MSCKQPWPQTIAERLDVAVRTHNISAIHTIIESAGADFDINIPDNEGELPLHCAVLDGDIETTRALLSHGASANSTRCIQHMGNYAESRAKYEHPLVLAAEMCNIPMVKLLLSSGANPNGVTVYRTLNLESGNSKVTQSIASIYLAVERSDLDLVKILLLHGATPDCRGPYGNTVFHIIAACTSWRRAVNGTQSAMFPVTDCEEQSDILRLLLKSCPMSETLKLRNVDGYTALRNAVLKGCITKVQLLLEAGLDPNKSQCPMAMDVHGGPLNIAIHSGFDDIAHSLLYNGANLNLCNFWGHTPLLSIMLRCQSADVMNATLIVHGASVKVKDHRGFTMLGICTRNSMEDCDETCRLLFYAGCSVWEEYWQRPFDHAQMREEGICHWLGTRRNNPHTLKDLSRIHIRNFLRERVTNGRSIVGSILNLPLPRLLQDHLLLKDFVDIDCSPPRTRVTPN